MGLIQEFRDFLKEYRILALAVAFIIGSALTSLVQSLVRDILMPFISPLTPNGNWANATATVGPVHIGVGSFMGNVINFVIIALVVFLIAKYVLRQEKVSKI